MSIWIVNNETEFLAAIAAGSAIQPGDVIELRAGTYTPLTAGAVSGSAASGKGVYKLGVAGISGHNITIKPYMTEKVRINGGFEDKGFTTFQGLEIAPTPTSRVFATKELATADIPIGIYDNKGGLNILDCYIHDCSEGISLFKADDASTDEIEISGNVLLNCGYYTEDLVRWRDYCIYTNNQPGGNIVIKKNFLGPCGGPWGVDMFSTSGRNIQDYQIINNVFVDAGIDCANGSSGLIDNQLISENDLYILDAGVGQNDRCIFLGLGNSINTLGIIFTDNYYVGKNLAGQVALFYDRQLLMTGNTIIKLANTAGGWFIGNYHNTYDPLTNDVDHNIYINLGTREFIDTGHPDVYLDFATWKSYEGFDANSTYSTTTLPSVNRIVVNTIRDRKVVAVYNWEGLASVNIPVGTGYFRISNPLNMNEYEYQWAVNGYVAVDMTGWTYSPMTGDYTGHNENVITDPWPSFASFIIDKIDLASSHDKTHITVVDMEDRTIKVS